MKCEMYFPTQSLFDWHNDILRSLISASSPFTAIDAQTSKSEDRQALNYRRARSQIHETESSYIADIELPGVKKEDIQIDLAEDTMSIKAEIQNKTSESSKEDPSKELQARGFFRQFTLPEHIEHENINADYRNGILRITLQKALDTKNTVRRLHIN